MGVGKCKKLGTRATKKERAEIHRAKMELKAALNGDREPRDEFVLANQSDKHPDWGETPNQQAARMLKNNS